MDTGSSHASVTTTAPLLALSVEAQTMLSALLNPTKIIPTETNLPRDWRGIAELSNVPAEKMSLFEGKSDPFKEILEFLCGTNGITICIDDLKAFLGVVDRFDVLEDVTPILDRDVASYKSRVSQMQLNRNVDTLSAQQDSAILTYEDSIRAQRKLPLCRYDAFILYSNDDSEFASEIITRMETEYELKLCSRDRDLLPGLRFAHEVIGKMIEARCNRLLVIFSPSFLESSENQFLVSYAQAVALDTRCRKIIPCVYKKCELPPSVRYSFCIDYNRSGKLWNFWDKLSQSLVVASSANSQITSAAAALSIKASNLAEPNANREVGRTVSQDSVEWWDASKPDKLSEQEPATGATTAVSTTNVSTNDYDPGKAIDDHYDAVSINSQAQLLPGVSSSSSERKPTKWLSKIMNRKKRGEKEKLKHKPIAE